MRNLLDVATKHFPFYTINETLHRHFTYYIYLIYLSSYANTFSSLFTHNNTRHGGNIAGGS